MPGLSNFGLSRSSSVRAAESQTTAASPPAVNTKLPYWAPTAEEVQAAQVVTTPSRSLSQRIGRKHVAASKATPTPTPAQAIPRKPVPTPAAPARAFSYEPVAGNPYAEAITTRSRNPTRASPAANKRSSSPPYIPNGRVQNFGQTRPLSPGSIFANGGTPPAPPATRKGSFAAISRGIGSLRKASSTVKKALAPQHEVKVASPVASQRGYSAGHILEPQEHVAPLNLVGLDVAQADTPRFAQPDFQIAADQEAAERARVAECRADSYRRLTGEAAPANLGSPSASNPAPPATNLALPKKTARKVVESTFEGVMDAGMDDSWVPNPRAGLDRPPPPPPEQSHAGPWNKGKGKASTPTDTPPPAPTNDPAALMFKKHQPKANQPLPATSAQPVAPLAPRPQQSTAVQLASQAPPVPGTDFTQDPRDRRASQMLRVTCAKCGKSVYAAAIPGHHCTKPKMTPAEKAAFNPEFEEFFQPQFAVDNAEDERPEVFIDTYVQDAQTVWRSAKRR